MSATGRHLVHDAEWHNVAKLEAAIAQLNFTYHLFAFI
jgi:hypothetical protein